MTENKTAEWINFAVNRASDIPVIGGRIRKVSMTYGPQPSLTQSSPSRLSTSSDSRPPPSYSSVQTSSSLVVSGGLDSKSIIANIEAKKVTKLDRQSIIQGLRMVDLAAVEYQEGNDSIALDIYLHGLDKIVMGLPASDPETRRALEQKLRLLERKLELPSIYQPVQHTQIMLNLKSFSDLIVHITVSCAKLIKASPVPGIAFSFIKTTIRIMRTADSTLHITQRIQNLLIYFVKVILDIDEKYQLHQLLSECVHMLFVASVKASIAFKESPGYQQSKVIDRVTRTTL
ncbi:unnamed protein product [Umbelopsis ramanniana]